MGDDDKITWLEEQLVDRTQAKEQYELFRNSLLGMSALLTVFMLSLWSTDTRSVAGDTLTIITNLTFDDATAADGWRRVAIFLLYRAIAIGIPVSISGALVTEGLLVPTKETAKAKDVVTLLVFLSVGVAAMCTMVATATVAYLVDPVIFFWLVVTGGIFFVVFLVAILFGASREEFLKLFEQRRRHKREIAALKVKLAAEVAEANRKKKK